MLHIRDCLPEIKSKIMAMMVTVQQNIDNLGESTDSHPQLLGATLLQLLSKFAASFGNSVDGRGSGSDCQVEMAELYGGARISFIFNEVFGKSLRALDPFEGLDDEDIRTAIANANGPRPSLFVPEIAFDLLVKKQIEKLLQVRVAYNAYAYTHKNAHTFINIYACLQCPQPLTHAGTKILCTSPPQPGLQCVDLVFDEMQRMAYQSETCDLSRFPDLRDRVFEIVNQLLRACMQPTQKMICNMIKIELAYINTSHPDFIGGKQAVAQLNRKFNAQVRIGERGCILSSPPHIRLYHAVTHSSFNLQLLPPPLPPPLPLPLPLPPPLPLLLHPLLLLPLPPARYLLCRRGKPQPTPGPRPPPGERPPSDRNRRHCRHCGGDTESSAPVGKARRCHGGARILFCAQRGGRRKQQQPA